MARIFKGSRNQLLILVSKCTYTSISDVRISFFTTNPSKSVTIDEGIAINGNIAVVDIPQNAFDSLNDGVLSYSVYGTRDGISFMEERQSNYYLRANIMSDDDPAYDGCKLQEKQVSFNDEYDTSIVVEPDYGYDGMSKVIVDRIGWYKGSIYRALENRLIPEMLQQGEAVAAMMRQYLNENEYSLEDFVENYFPELDDIYGEQYYIIPFRGNGCKDISNIGNAPTVIYFTMDDASEVERCVNTFNGWRYLAVCTLPDLGNSFKEPQTLDMSQTSIKYPDTMYLAESLYDFSKGPNQYGVETSYVKGIDDIGKEHFTKRGWQII